MSSFFNTNVSVDESSKLFDTFNWEPPRASYSYSGSLKLTQDERITWKGGAMVHFIVDDIIQNETISFNLSYVIPISASDLYNMEIIAFLLLFVWIISFVLIPLILKVIIQPNFGLYLDEEAKEKQKEYLDFLRERKTKEENESN